MQGFYVDQAQGPGPLLLIGEGDNAGRPFYVVRVRVQIVGSPAWIEGARDETGTLILVMRGLEQCRTLKQIELAARPALFLQKFVLGAPRGPRKGGEVERWVQRALQAGEATAYAEFKAETPAGRGQWQARYRWWYRHVRPLVQESR